MKKLTVMVSIYNSGEWIENRLNNILQSHNRHELDIWCVNTDSPDPRDDEIPRKFDVHYVKLPNRLNVYETWNYIIGHSTTPYVTNANTDDIVAPDCYQRLIQVLDKGADFTYCSWFCTDIANQQWGSLREFDRSGKPGHFRGDIGHGGVGHFPMWRRDLHHTLGFFDAKFGALADVDWWTRCYYVGRAKFVWVEDFLAAYLWRNGENLWHRSVSDWEWERYHKKVEEYRKGNACLDW